MASRTPKHMPKCSARMIFILLLWPMALAPSLCIAKLKTTGVLVCSKDFSFRPGLLDDLLQQIDVAGEGFLAGRRQGVGRERAIVRKRFRDDHVTGLLERAHVGGQV